MLIFGHHFLVFVFLYDLGRPKKRLGLHWNMQPISTITAPMVGHEHRVVKVNTHSMQETRVTWRQGHAVMEITDL